MQLDQNIALSTQDPYKTPQTDLNTVQVKPFEPAFWSKRGRIGRVRFFSYTMIFNLYSLLCVAIFDILKNGSVVTPSLGLAFLFMTIAYLPTLCSWVIMAKRRMFDYNKGGLLAFLMLVPLVNIALWFFLITKPGEKQLNQFGAPPSNNGALLLAFTTIMATCCLGIVGFFAFLVMSDIAAM